MLLISISDLIDGRVARSRENKCKGGDIFDFVADFLVIFSIFMLWYLEQKVSLYIVFLILFSFIAFSYIVFVKKRVVKNKIGQYVGAVCFSGIIVIFLARLYFEKIYLGLTNLVLVIISIYLIISIVENIWNVIKKKDYFF